MTLVSKVLLYICVSFGLFYHELHDLSKKIIVITSGNSCHFVNLFSYFCFSSRYVTWFMSQQPKTNTNVEHLNSKHSQNVMKWFLITNFCCLNFNQIFQWIVMRTPQFYIQFILYIQVYKPHFGTWILLFWPNGQLRALIENEYFSATFEGGFFKFL